MAIYNLINNTLKNSFRTIDIVNINTSSTHLGSEEEIVEFLDKVAFFSADPAYNERELVSMIHDYFKHSSRILNVKFYKCKKNIVALIFSDSFGLKQEKDFSQKATLKCLANKVEFSIVQVPHTKYSDIQKGDISVPKSWKPAEDLNNFYSKLNIFFK